jgi:hypothetical protein
MLTGYRPVFVWCIAVRGSNSRIPFCYLRFYVPLKNFSFIFVTIAGEGCKILSLSSALRAFDQGGIEVLMTEWGPVRIRVRISGLLRGD